MSPTESALDEIATWAYYTALALVLGVLTLCLIHAELVEINTHLLMLRLMVRRLTPVAAADLPVGSPDSAPAAAVHASTPAATKGAAKDVRSENHPLRP